MRTPALLAFACLLAASAHSELPISAAAPYIQNFDTLPGAAGFTWTNDSTLPGWAAAPGSGSLSTTAAVSSGTSNPPALTLISVGATASTERALAYHTQLASAPTYVGVGFTNDTGAAVSSFSLSFTAEQWREATNARTVGVSVQYKVGTSLTDLGGTVDWISVAGTEFTTLNGSATASATLTVSNIPVSIPAGSSFWIRWRFTNTATSATNSHDLLAIDNVALSFAGGGGSTNVAPAFTAHPQTQTVTEGDTVVFSATASGIPTPTLQWFLGADALSGETGNTLTLNAVTSSANGTYTVVATNSAGSATSDPAVLTVNPPAPLPPSILAHPTSRNAPPGSSTTFTVVASGTGPLSYAWSHNGSPLPLATSPSLTLTGVTPANAGSYTVSVSSALGSVTSNPAVLTVTNALAPSAFNLAGFAQAATGGGVIAESNAAYRKVYTPADFRSALSSAATRVIEIMNDLNLGWNELPPSEQTGRFRSNATPSLHPVLLTTGVSIIDIQDLDNVTIFSANGATIRHAEFNIKRCTNVIVRNLRFDELWEWDEATKGDYDSKDWDFITVDMASTNVWIDHCDFGKAYDGVLDLKGGSNNVTVSWCRFIEDDGGPSSWVRRQINALEANSSSYAMYHFLRTNGFSAEDIIAVARSQKKGHLSGANDFDTDNALLSITLHHNLYRGMQDRLPRLRGGNAHSYNLWVDNRNAFAARQLYDTRVAAMTPTNALRLSNGTYKFAITQNGAISTESGSVLLERSYLDGVRYALRNNQTDPANPAYTGRIRAIDVIFKFGAIDFRGGSDTPGHPLGPDQAPELLPFAWAGMPSLPYSYTTDDPADLPDLIDRGAGAGVLQWEKSNWLRTSYPAGDAAPSIASQPVSVQVADGAAASFTVVFSGTPTPTLQWLRNGTPIQGATSATLPIASASSANLGTYTAVLSNTYGTISTAPAQLTLAPALTGFPAWLQGAGLTGAAPESDPDGDGIPLLAEYALGLSPSAPDANAASLPTLLQASGPGGPVFRFTRPKSVSGVTYTVETTTSLSAGWTGTVVASLESQTETTETYAATLTSPGGTLFARLRLQLVP